jgi:tetratricopeptide (TPR) repeat protein
MPGHTLPLLKLMKPRAFIGSSVEGLSIAYAVQQNLLHDAEVTVWDQGVFELSATTIESLSKALSATDFGIFIFSSDDVLKLRGESSPTVRDNVLFEMGLFIGKLGRDRVFFLVPTGAELHIPSDLLGVTPGKYETNRADGSMQAATGAACHQIRSQVKKIGPIYEITPIPSVPDEVAKPEPERRTWIQDFFERKYSAAKATLEASLPEEEGDNLLEATAWIHYCEFKEDERTGLQKLTEYAKQNSRSPKAQTMAALVLKLERYTDKAIALLTSVDEEIRNHPSILVALSNCYAENQEPDKAIDILRSSSPVTYPEIAIALSEILEKEDQKTEACEIIHACHVANPRNIDIRYRYARLAQELDLYTVALYLLNGLTDDEPNSSEYWGYLGNTCLVLQLHDKALIAYRKAESLIQFGASGQWIISNIGNLLSNKGLPSEACIYLERAIKMESESDYAHDRLAGAIKKKDAESKEYTKKVAEGLKAIRNKELSE